MISDPMRTEMYRMDREAEGILRMLNVDLPEISSNLCFQTVVLDRLSRMEYSVDRLVEYRVLSGKLSIELFRLKNITINLRRRVENISDDAGKLLRMVARSLDMTEEVPKKGGKIPC
jgi:hypothetical protein